MAASRISSAISSSMQHHSTIATADDFDLLLPADRFMMDGNGFFLEEYGDDANGGGQVNSRRSSHVGQNQHQQVEPMYLDASLMVPMPHKTEQGVIRHSTNKANGNSGDNKRRYRSATTEAAEAAAAAATKLEDSRPASPPPGDDDHEDDVARRAKRRKQIAAASRQSRARRKRELEDLRNENMRLREERAQFLKKIGELQHNVETLREQGSTDMRMENELLRAQLEEHKRFVTCFKQLSDGAPSSVNAKHAIYRQGAEAAQSHVLGLVSQSQVDDWQKATLPDDADLPYQNLSVFYKFVDEFGSSKKVVPKIEGASSSVATKPMRQRLNMRVDVLFPGSDPDDMAEFFWESFSDTGTQQRIFGSKGVEATLMTDDMPDKNTKMVYYREQCDKDEQDQDMVALCFRERKELAKSSLALPGANKVKTAVGKVSAMVLSMSTTQHAPAPEFDKARRITSMFVQGATVWSAAADTRLCVVFSFPDDIKLKTLESLEDVISRETGMLNHKFCDVLKEYKTALGESAL